ncbi:MAG: DHH family phosphoesterase [Myxococcales bacterium]|nr:DHH family phosphoesterase [Myxococcales bacterium]
MSKRQEGETTTTSPTKVPGACRWRGGVTANGRLLRAIERRLFAVDKLKHLREVVQGHERALIVMHDNPDPDALGSALALRLLFECMGVREAVVAYGGSVGRAENRTLISLLKLSLQPIATVQPETFDLFALVDTQPTAGNHSLPEARFWPQVVIDHHPWREASHRVAHADVDPSCGAASTLLVEALSAAELEPSRKLATALYYGIKSDTDDLADRASQADLSAYMQLFPLADRALLHRIEHPALPARYFQLVGQAYQRARIHRDLVESNLGELYSPELTAEIAEQLLMLEGMHWSLTYGTFRRQLFVSVRSQGPRRSAGRTLSDLCNGLEGSSGGHVTMAGARLTLPTGEEAAWRFKQVFLARFLKRLGIHDLLGVSLSSVGLIRGADDSG